MKVYKIRRNMDNGNTHSHFPMVEDFKTTGTRHKRREEKFERDLGPQVFTWKVVHIWRELPEEAIRADTITTSKTH